MDFQSFLVPWHWPFPIYHRWQRNVEDSLRHVHHTQRELRTSFKGFSLGDSDSRSYSRSSPGIVTGLSWLQDVSLVKLQPWSMPLVNPLQLWIGPTWSIFSITSPISIFRQSRRLLRFIFGKSIVRDRSDATAASAGSAAVLLIFILIFNFGARKLSSYLHKKLTLCIKERNDRI